MALSKKRLLPNHTFRKKRFHIENRFPHGITHVREFFTWNHTSESFSRGITRQRVFHMESHVREFFTWNHTSESFSHGITRQRVFHVESHILKNVSRGITHFRECFTKSHISENVFNAESHISENRSFCYEVEGVSNSSKLRYVLNGVIPV